LSATLAQDEKGLLHRLKDGDEAALTLLYKAHWQPLFLAAYNILKDKRACEDIVQELFLQLWLKRETLDVKISLQAYMATAVRYQVFHYIRKAAKAPVLSKQMEENNFAVSSDETLLQNDVRKQVAEAVAELPEKCRLIYTLSREEQLSHKEIATLLNISTKTVENQLTIALRRVRHHLEYCTITKLLLLFFLF
jgi:RNA polymerase sigma-70 factor (ECF subfamily)